MNNPHQDARLTRHSREQVVARALAGQTAGEVASSIRMMRKRRARFRAGGRRFPTAPASRAAATVALIVYLRRSLRLTGATIAARLGLAQIDQPGHRVTGDRRGRNRGAGRGFVHVAVDDAARLACGEVLADARKDTTGFLLRCAGSAPGASPSRATSP